MIWNKFCHKPSVVSAIKNILNHRLCLNSILKHKTTFNSLNLVTLLSKKSQNTELLAAENNENSQYVDSSLEDQSRRTEK